MEQLRNTNAILADRLHSVQMELRLLGQQVLVIIIVDLVF